MNEELQKKLLEILDALQHGTVLIGDKVYNYAPDTLDMLLWIVRVNGIQAFITSLVSIILFVFGIRLTQKCYARRTELCKERRNYFDEEDIFLIAVRAAPTAIVGFFAAIGMYQLVSVWTYVAIFQPKLWLAKELVEKVLK